MKEYILVTTGFHFSGFVMHCVETKKNDFVEMGMHHLLTIYLMVGMYLFNAWEIGAVIAF